jgi:SAM-dependent methyltransferase
MSQYDLIFRHRGESYDSAMKKCPNARDAEFKQLFSKIPLTKNEIILDVPALGGYLKKYCLEDTKVICLDFSKSINGIDIVSPYDKWDVPNVNRIVCLAALHHVENLQLFLNNLKNHLSPGGIIHLADVSLKNPISKFLDDFVGARTSTGGHKGIYYDWKQVAFPENLKIINLEDRFCPWVFQSELEMAEYCRFLFDLRDTDDKDILDALNLYVGYEKKQDLISLNWNLTYVDLQLNT